MRFVTNRSTTPAATNVPAAIAIEIFVGLVAQTILITHVVIRAIQKPNSTPEIINLCPRFLFTWKMVMCATAPRMKSTRKTARIGTSTLTVGMRPDPAFLGGYGACRGEGALAGVNAIV